MLLQRTTLPRVLLWTESLLLLRSLPAGSLRCPVQGDGHRAQHPHYLDCYWWSSHVQGMMVVVSSGLQNLKLHTTLCAQLYRSRYRQSQQQEMSAHPLRQRPSGALYFVVSTQGRQCA